MPIDETHETDLPSLPMCGCEDEEHDDLDDEEEEEEEDRTERMEVELGDRGVMGAWN